MKVAFAENVLNTHSQSSHDGDSFLGISGLRKIMNILSLIVHGSKETPDLGELEDYISTPPLDTLGRATLGLG